MALAALAGVLAAPIYRVSPLMGADLIIVVFAVVVIGGMGSILGSIVTGFGLGRHRGADQGVLPGGLEHGGVRDHGHRAPGEAGRALREDGVTAPGVESSPGIEARPAGRDEMRSLRIPIAAWSRCCWWRRSSSTPSS